MGPVCTFASDLIGQQTSLFVPICLTKLFACCKKSCYINKSCFSERWTSFMSNFLMDWLMLRHQVFVLLWSRKNGNLSYASIRHDFSQKRCVAISSYTSTPGMVWEWGMSLWNVENVYYNRHIRHFWQTKFPYPLTCCICSYAYLSCNVCSDLIWNLLQLVSSKGWTLVQVIKCAGHRKPRLANQ